MTAKTSNVILIVENDTNTFHMMIESLIKNVSCGGSAVQIIHATTLDDAKAKLLLYSPKVVSTSMKYPHSEGHTADNIAGKYLIRFSQLKKQPISFVVYTGTTLEETRQHLINAGIKGMSIPGWLTIIQKGVTTGHTNWVRAVLDACHFSEKIK